MATNKNNVLDTKQPQQVSQTVAVVDLGSNSFHLVLARIINDDVQILLREKIKVRLATGLDAKLMLSNEAIERGLSTLKIYAETLKGFHPDDVNIIATYTLRTAKNSQRFLSKAKKIIPYPIEVISGQEEARLIYQGVAHSMHHVGNRLVIDIGGGSTEFIIGEGFKTKALASRNIGCVNLTTLFFADGHITKERFNKAFIHCEQQLQPIINQYQSLGWQAALGTSGTISALTEIAIANGFVQSHLTSAALTKIKDLVLSFKHVDDIALDGLTEDRPHIILAGLIVLIAAFEMLNIESLEYCDKALREGALYEMEDKLKQHDIRKRSVQSLTKRLAVDKQQSKRVYKTVEYIFDQAQTGWQLANIVDAKLMLQWACQLLEVGLHINSSSFHKHSAYVVANSTMPGFNQEELQLLSTLLRLHRKKLVKELIPTLSLFNKRKIGKLIAILRLSVVLNLKRQSNFLPKFKVVTNKDKIVLEFAKAWLHNKPLVQANLENEITQLAKIGIELEVISI